MGIEFLSDGHQNAVAHLCHYVHTELDSSHHQKVQHSRKGNEPHKAGNISPGNIIVNGLLHNQRIEKGYYHTESHNKQYQNDFFFVGKQIGKHTEQGAPLALA